VSNARVLERGRRVGAVLAATLAVLLTAHAAAVHADADPASDVLFNSVAFFPYEPAVSPSLARQLQSLLGQMQRSTFPLRVAIIATPVDLGGVPQIFGKPVGYSRFLSIEMKNFYTGSSSARASYLVVMPDGVGLASAGVPEDTAALAGLRAPHARNLADSLTEEAILAVRRLARSRGLRLVASKQAVASGAGSPPAGLLAGLAATVVLLAGGILSFRARRAGRVATRRGSAARRPRAVNGLADRARRARSAYERWVAGGDAEGGEHR
jgi:hypothetical protein